MVLLVIGSLFIIPVILISCAICIMSIWGYLSTIFNKSSSLTKQGHMMFWGIGIPMGIFIFVFLKDVLPILEFPTTLIDFKNEILEDFKTFGIVIAGVVGGGVIMWGGLGILVISLTQLYLIINKYINSPFKNTKIYYRKFLKNINNKDYLKSLTGFIEINSFKQKCIEFESINSLPFNFKKTFFIHPTSFDRKRKGERYNGGGYGTPDSYKSIEEYSNDWYWRDRVKVNRVNYLKFFSNNFPSKNMLKYQFMVNNLYIPITFIFSIIEFHYFNYFFCLPILYSCLYFIIKKKYPKDFKIEYYEFKTGLYYLVAATLLIPGLAMLNYFVQTLSIGRAYDNDFLYFDLGFTLFIIIFNLFSDLYDYKLEKFMNSIFCRILINEQLFCFFYTLNCFEVRLEESIKVSNELNEIEEVEKRFNIKFNPEIDFK